MKGQKGFTGVEGLLIVLIIAVLGFTGYYVWSQNKSNVKDSSANTTSTATKLKTSASTANETPKDASKTIDNKYFTMKLPAGWAEVSTAKLPVGDADFGYGDSKGREVYIIVNVGGHGGNYDATGTYTVANNMFKFNSLTFCTPDIFCGYGDGKLVVVYTSADKVNGNNYEFDIKDNNTETQTAADALTAILETIQVK